MVGPPSGSKQPLVAAETVVTGQSVSRRIANYVGMYEDEYDDSFDDLGAGAAEGEEEAEATKVRPSLAMASTSSGYKRNAGPPQHPVAASRDGEVRHTGLGGGRGSSASELSSRGGRGR